MCGTRDPVGGMTTTVQALIDRYRKNGVRDVSHHAEPVADRGRPGLRDARRGTPSGLVRIGCPVAFCRLHVAPRLWRLLDRYPR
jgi:hypothetical protein